jgi:hypothetical protein
VRHEIHSPFALGNREPWVHFAFVLAADDLESGVRGGVSAALITVETATHAWCNSIPFSIEDSTGDLSRFSGDETGI